MPRLRLNFLPHKSQGKPLKQRQLVQHQATHTFPGHALLFATHTPTLTQIHNQTSHNAQQCNTTTTTSCRNKLAQQVLRKVFHNHAASSWVYFLFSDSFFLQILFPYCCYSCSCCCCCSCGCCSLEFSTHTFHIRKTRKIMQHNMKCIWKTSESCQVPPSVRERLWLPHSLLLSLGPTLGLLLLRSQNTWVGALIKSQIFHAMRQAAQRDDDGAEWRCVCVCVSWQFLVLKLL